MNKFFIALCVAVVASAQVYGYSAGSGYQNQEHAADAGAGEYGHAADGGASAGAAVEADGGAAGASQSIPYQPANTRGNTISSSISHPNNKGEILIHRPAAIIVKRPPTKVVVNHPPLVVKPAPVVLHKPPAVIVRKVFVKHHPRPVKVEPVYVNVVKPPAEKYFVNEKQQAAYAAQGYAPVNVNADYGSAGHSVNGESGYHLLQNSHGLAGLASLSGSAGYGQGSASSHSSYNAPSY